MNRIRMGLLAALSIILGAAWAGNAATTAAPATAPSTASSTTRAEVPTSLTVDDSLPEYTPVASLSGVVNSAGSSIVSNFLNRWAVEFRKIYPDVRIQVSAGGSEMAIAPLLKGEVQLASLSREMHADELALFQKKFGYEPTRIIVAADALAIFVNKDNPLPSISLRQADAVFSSTHKRGGPAIDTWGGLGLTGEWTKRPIAVIGLGGTSGSAQVFRELVLLGGDFHLAMEKDLVSSSVIQGVGADAAAIGYGSFVLRTKRAQALPILDDAGVPRAPTQENVLSGKYPLSRFLNIYINKTPKKDLEPTVKELLKYILSKDGQAVLVAGGNLPLSSSIVTEQRKMLGN